ncbi:asparagine synthase (glutamine-hydrolyzing) [Sphingobacteriales bacterium CHB3]|nr:asparagine synthase (glutamine-hydrolyzing) [Sphingobacteriales bacterium CHB3]
MCGIAGIFSFKSREPVNRGLVERMTASLNHRGPDGEGFYFSNDQTLGFGHRRLAIIDLATGDQPMCNEDGTVWITFNGEIYNYRELRGQLKARGHRFKTASDTEVIIHAYEEWGNTCATKFNGIFAFAIWDEKERSLYLARDHYGVKPLYYCENGRTLSFASEMKAILCDRNIPRTLDYDALHFCLTFRHTPSPWTLFKSIRKLPPSSYMVVDADGVHVSCYWNQAPVIDRHKKEEEWVEELVEAYPEAVHRQMVSDTPIGLSLSGGVDSNTLLALMSQHQNHVHTFTIGFEGSADRDDEVSVAGEAAREYDADFTSRRVSETDYVAFMNSYLWHLEEPVGNESAAAYYFVAKLAREKVKVLLSGQGADEPFAGYGRHLAAQYLPYLGWLPSGFVRAIGGLIRPFFRHESPGRLIDRLSQADEIHQFLSTYSITTRDMRIRLFNPDFVVQSSPYVLSDYVRSQLARAPLGSPLEKMAYIDARTSLSDNLLLCGDKMAMAAGVEMRVPFLDLEVMRVAERIPGDFKVRDFQNKVVHKKACERWLPQHIVHRRKIGFNEAMGVWMGQNLDRLLTDLTSSPESVTRTMLNPEYVKQLQQEHNSGKHDHQRILFLLLSIETWRKVFA